MNLKALKIIAVVVGIIIFYFVVVMLSGLFRGGGQPSQAPRVQTTLEFWNVFDKSSTFEPLLADFQRQTGIRVNYRSFTDLADYKATLLEELAAGEGPDVLAMHNTWLTKYNKILRPLPQADLGYSPEWVAENFVDTVARDVLTVQDSSKKEKEYDIMALPMYIDSLALFYNSAFFRDILDKPHARPETTWAGIREDVIGLAVPDDSDPEGFRITGLAAGRADNISRGLEIFWTLFLQNGGGQIADTKGNVALGKAGSEAVDFLTRFSRSSDFSEYSWNAKLGMGAVEKEIDAFARGKVAMIAGYSYYREAIESLVQQYEKRGLARQMSFADIGVAPMPQLLDPAAGHPKVALADYFALAAARTSEHPQAAWQLILHLNNAASQQSYFESTGKPSSRRDLLTAQQSDPESGVFARQAVQARSMPMLDADKYNAAVAKMLDAVADGNLTPAQSTAAFEKYLSCELRAVGECVFGRR